MTNQEKYNKIFMDCMDVSSDQLNEKLVYNSIATWDSIGHMKLMAALETEFDIMMETDDIIGFNSYLEGKKILARYGVEF